MRKLNKKGLILCLLAGEIAVLGAIIGVTAIQAIRYSNGEVTPCKNMNLDKGYCMDSQKGK